MSGQIYQDDPTAPPVGPPKPSYAGFGTPMTPPSSISALMPGNNGPNLSALLPQQGNGLASEDNPDGTISPEVTSDPGQAATLSEYYRAQSPQGALSRAVDQFQRGNDPGGEQLKTVASAAKESQPPPNANALTAKELLPYLITKPIDPYDAGRLQQEQKRLEFDTSKANQPKEITPYEQAMLDLKKASLDNKGDVGPERAQQALLSMARASAASMGFQSIEEIAKNAGLDLQQLRATARGQSGGQAQGAQLQPDQVKMKDEKGVVKLVPENRVDYFKSQGKTVVP